MNGPVCTKISNDSWGALEKGFTETSKFPFNTNIMAHLSVCVDDSQSVVVSQGTTMATIQGKNRRRGHRYAERRRRNLCASVASAKALLLLLVTWTCLHSLVGVGGTDDPSQLENKDKASGGVKINPSPADDGSNNNNHGESYASATLQKLASAESEKVIGSADEAATVGSATTGKSEHRTYE